MFVVDLKYVASLEKIDAAMKEHMVFLNKYYKSNNFIASGRKVPRTGGIILVLADSLEEAESIIKEDPFVINKLAQYTITEFKTSQVHPDLKKVVGSK